jgi:hypothetical protein
MVADVVVIIGIIEIILMNFMLVDMVNKEITEIMIMHFVVADITMPIWIIDLTFLNKEITEVMIMHFMMANTL